MTTAPPNPDSTRRWLRAYLGSSSAALVAVALPFLRAASENPFVLVALPFVLVPYLALFLALVAPVRKAAFGLAPALSSFVLLLTAVLLLNDWATMTPGWAVLYGLLLAGHAALAVSAYKAWDAFFPQPRFVFRVGRVLLPASLAALVYFGVPEMVTRSRQGGDAQAANETRALRTLRSLGVALVDYHIQYQKGFPPTLDVLKPPSELIHPDVLRGRAHRGYVVSYSAGPPDSEGVIPTYTLQARPQNYGQTGQRSFFTDDSWVIRFTREDRPATAHDPPVE